MNFKTDRLLLRPWMENDVKDLFKYASNPNVGPRAGWPPHTSMEDSLYIIQTVFSKKETYAIEIKGEAVGCVSLLIHPDGNHWWGEGSAELGFWIAEEFWNQGFVTEASKLLINHAFDDLDIKQIYATYRYGNIQSRRVLEKLGFKYYTELNNMDYLNNHFREIAMILEK